MSDTIVEAPPVVAAPVISGYKEAPLKGDRYELVDGNTYYRVLPITTTDILEDDKKLLTPDKQFALTKMKYEKKENNNDYFFTPFLI